MIDTINLLNNYKIYIYFEISFLKIIFIQLSKLQMLTIIKT
jgi:hypothetical protein